MDGRQMHTQNINEQNIMNPETQHEKLLEDISDQLAELSLNTSAANKKNDILPEIPAPRKTEGHSERVEKMQTQLRKSQDELKSAQQEIHDKIKSLDTIGFGNSDLNREIKRLSEQLEQERMNNSKLSTDLARSLELNLRLQFENEEIRSKAMQNSNEEKKHNSFLQDKIKSINHELDLSQALANETRLELAKAKEKFLSESNNWQQEKKNLIVKIDDLSAAIGEKQDQIDTLKTEMLQKSDEIQKISESIGEYESHTQQQHEMMRTLTDVAEKKMIELKIALDRKTLESQDYYSHLQQAMTQIHVLRQENSALKDYISKLTNLHQQRANEARA